MRIIEAINDEVIYPDEKTLFLAGGITGCPGWQYDMYSIFEGLNRTIINPRRKDFPMDDSDASEHQIYWEHRHLKLSKEILFWFPKETLCPITLYELGTWIRRMDKAIYIGIHPEYRRKDDVIIQTRLVRPEVAENIAWSLMELGGNVLKRKGNR